MKLSRLNSTTGTGASGEMRETSPHKNWSSIASPVMITVRRAAVFRMFRARCRVSVLRSAISLFQRLFFKKTGEWAGRAGRAKLLAKANFVSRAARLNGGFESKSHA